MAGLVTNVGEKTVLNLLFDGATNPRFRLYKNDYTPDADAVLASFTEADFPGYAALDLADATAPVTQPDGKTLRTLGNATFERAAGAGSQTVYGWYITIERVAGTPEPYAAGRLDAPRVLQAPGDKVSLDLDITATDLSS